MKIVEGKYETALVYTDNIDDASLAQVKTSCDMPYAKRFTGYDEYVSC